MHVYTCMHACLHACMHACMHAWYASTHPSIQTYAHTYIHTCIHPSIHPNIHTYIHTCIHPSIQTYIHTYLHTYIHAYIHTYMHTYTHTFWQFFWQICYDWCKSPGELAIWDEIQTQKTRELAMPGGQRRRRRNWHKIYARMTGREIWKNCDGFDLGPIWDCWQHLVLRQPRPRASMIEMIGCLDHLGSFWTTLGCGTHQSKGAWSVCYPAGCTKIASTQRWCHRSWQSDRGLSGIFKYTQRSICLLAWIYYHLLSIWSIWFF